MVVVVVGVRFLAGQVPGKTEPPKERAAEMDEKTLVSQLSLRWILDTLFGGRCGGGNQGNPRVSGFRLEM